MLYLTCFLIFAACECDPIGSTSSQCNSVTGQCPCIDGAGGRQCDQCLRGFTGTVPNCEPCGECFDNWDAIIDELKGWFCLIKDALTQCYFT